MDATLSLLGLALLAFVGVAAHAWWRTRRALPRRAEADDALATVNRTEPGLEPSSEPGRAPTLHDRSPSTLGEGLEALGQFSAGEPDLDVSSKPVGMPRGATLRPFARLDALIDAIVPMSVEQAVSGDAALAHWPRTSRAGTKPMHIEGLNQATQTWEQPQYGQVYIEFQAGVQLANRMGALNQIEYSEFVQKVQVFAEGINALADFPDMLDVSARARELDAFAGPLDAQLNVKLVARSVSWSVGYIEQCAARHGLMPGALPGRLVLPGEGEMAPPVLVLSFDHRAALAEDPQDAVLHEVDLSLDVAQTSEDADPFPTWHRLATLLAKDMDAALLDDRGQPITLHAFDAIGKDLKTLYQSLAARDLAAGSAAARRLFS